MASDKISQIENKNIILATTHYSDIALDFMTFILFHIHNLNNDSIKISFELDSNLVELDIAGYINDCVIWSPIRFNINVGNTSKLLFIGKEIDRAKPFNEAQFVSMLIEEYTPEHAERLFKLIAFQ